MNFIKFKDKDRRTKVGAINKKRYGDDFYRVIGRAGGSKGSADGVIKGGKISKRGKAKK